MQLYHGATVFTVDSKEAARVDRVVIDPQSNLVTHLVLRKGWLFSADKVVPVDAVAVGEDGAIVLHLKAEQLAELPDFEETEYSIVDEHEPNANATQNMAGPMPAVYWNPSYPEPPVAPAVNPAYVAETKVNIPDGTVAIKPGAKVISADKKDVGHVDLVLTSPSPERVTHLLISHGLLLKDHKLVPVRWIDNWQGDEVSLVITAKTFESLPSFEMAQ